MNWLIIPEASIQKTSLDLIKTKRKKGLKIFLTDTFAKIIGVSYTQIAAEGCW